MIKIANSKYIPKLHHPPPHSPHPQNKTKTSEKSMKINGKENEKKEEINFPFTCNFILIFLALAKRKNEKMKNRLNIVL